MNTEKVLDLSSIPDDEMTDDQGMRPALPRLSPVGSILPPQPLRISPSGSRGSEQGRHPISHRAIIDRLHHPQSALLARQRPVLNTRPSAKHNNDWYNQQHGNNNGYENSIELEPISPPDSPSGSMSNSRSLLNGGVFTNRLKTERDLSNDDYSDDDHNDNNENNNDDDEHRNAKAFEEYLKEICNGEISGSTENAAILRQAAYENWMETKQRLKWKKRYHTHISNDDSVSLSSSSSSSSGKNMTSNLAHVTLTPNESPELLGREEMMTDCKAGINGGYGFNDVRTDRQLGSGVKSSPLKRQLEEYRVERDGEPEMKDVLMRNGEGSSPPDRNNPRYRCEPCNTRVLNCGVNDDESGLKTKRFIAYNDINFNDVDSPPWRRDEYVSSQQQQQFSPYNNREPVKLDNLPPLLPVNQSPSLDSRVAMELRRAVELRSASRMSNHYMPLGIDISQSSHLPGSSMMEISPSRRDEDGKYGSDKDAAYWERRRKNNEAAKRSRDSRRAKEEQTARRASQLAEENLQLRAQIAILKTETANLQLMLYNRMK